ncbi:MAG: CdaR family protein [Prevotella sp.]
MMTLNETYERELKVPLRLVGAPRNVVITSAPSDTIRLTVRDKGFVLITYDISHKLRTLQMNFNTYANKQSGHGIIPMADVQKLIKQQLASSTTITSIKADQLDFFFNYGLKKKVKIELVGNIQPAKNYYLSHIEMSPEVALVYASKKLLDSIQTISTEFVNIVNFDDTVVCNVKLKAIRGAKFEPSSIQLKLYPDILTEESMEVPIQAINKPDDLIIRTFPQKVKVNFTVGANMFRDIRPEDFKVVVDYKEIQAHPSDKCNLYLTDKPHGVRKAKPEIEQVDYLIEQQ